MEKDADSAVNGQFIRTLPNFRPRVEPRDETVVVHLSKAKRIRLYDFAQNKDARFCDPPRSTGGADLGKGALLLDEDQAGRDSCHYPAEY